MMDILSLLDHYEVKLSYDYEDSWDRGFWSLLLSNVHSHSPFFFFQIGPLAYEEPISLKNTIGPH